MLVLSSRVVSNNTRSEWGVVPLDWDNENVSRPSDPMEFS